MPEVLARRRHEARALVRQREKAPDATRPIEPVAPPANLALVAGAMDGAMVSLKVGAQGGPGAPAWVGRLVGGRDDEPKVETETIASVCLDALELAVAETLANTLAARGFSVYPAPLPAVSSHADPIRRRRAAHADPQMQARQALFKARHALEALLEQAAIPVVGRPMLLGGHIGALGNIINSRHDLDSIPLAGWTGAEEPAPAPFSTGLAIPPGHRSAVRGSGPVAAWFFRPLDGGPVGRLQVPAAWWVRHRGKGADMLTAWALHMMAAGGNNPLHRLDGRLAALADSRDLISSIGDLVA